MYPPFEQPGPVILLIQLELIMSVYHWSTKMRAYIRREYLSLIKVQEAEQKYNRPQNLLSCNITRLSTNQELSARQPPSFFFC